MGRDGLTPLVLAALLLTGSAAQAQAQALDARVVEFLPAAQATLADGRPAVTHYDVEIAVAGTGQPLQRVTLGAVAVDADGLVRVNVAAAVTVAPVAGTAYVARVLAVGPQGTTVSVASNPFTFSRCTTAPLAAGTPRMAAGDTGTVAVVVSGPRCGWTATSATPWLTVTAGAAGVGPGRVAYTVSPNPTTTPRVATLVVGAQRYPVTQAGVVARTVRVTTEAELQAAVATVTSHTTIVLAAGRYRLTTTLRLVGPLVAVTLRGATGRAADVRLEGAGMTAAGPAATALQVTGAVHGLIVADLTLAQFAAHALRLDVGVQAPHLVGLRLQDTGAALLRVAAGVDDGVVETSDFAYTTTGVSAAAAGIDLRGAARWTIRGNTFRHVRAPAGLQAAAAVTAHAGARDTRVEQNVFLDCQAGIAFGQIDRAGDVDHRGGRIANNVFSRAATVAGGPGIALIDAPATVVTHNTILTGGTAAPIALRFLDTTDVRLANNLTDGALRTRDGAWALEMGNVTTATADLFVDAAGGDLHLRPTAAAALGQGQATGDAADTDIDGDARRDDRSDVGADEAITQS